MAAFHGKVRACGEAASASLSSNLKNTVVGMKRLLGLKFSDDQVKREMEYLPFTCVENPANGGVAVQVMYEGEQMTVSIELATNMMLRHMADIAKEANKGQAALDWVVCVPAWYTDSQKRSFLDSCQLAGINCLKLMHETTASALAYGIFKDAKKEFAPDKPTNVVFIDMGATGYTASAVSYTPQKLTTLATYSDSCLGGRDFDAAIANWARDKFCAKYKNARDPKEIPKSWHKLLLASEKAKKTLSPAGVKEANLNIECLVDEYDFNCTLTAADFEEMVQPLIDRLANPINRMFEDAEKNGISRADFSSFELVGGGTRVGCVKRNLSKILKLDASSTNFGLSTTMNADEAVARGCALQSAILSSRFKVKPYDIVESSLHGVQLEFDDHEGKKEVVEVFERGSNFGVVKRVTVKQNQPFRVKVSASSVLYCWYFFFLGLGQQPLSWRSCLLEGTQATRTMTNILLALSRRFILTRLETAIKWIS